MHAISRAEQGDSNRYGAGSSVLRPSKIALANLLDFYFGLRPEVLKFWGLEACHACLPPSLFESQESLCPRALHGRKLRKWALEVRGPPLLQTAQGDFIRSTTAHLARHHWA